MMDTLSAFFKGEASRGNSMMVFDWHKAARIIKENKPCQAAAGLQSDWEWTGGPIFDSGEIVPKDDTYTYLESTWAIPELEIDGVIQDCYIMSDDSPGWNAGTYWPDSARAILNNTDEEE